MAKLAYDAKRCGKCHGTGVYQPFGACWACRGVGTRVTPAGRRAQALVEAFIETHFSHPAAALRKGDQFTDTLVSFQSIGTAVSRRRVVWSVIDVTLDATHGGRLVVSAAAVWRREQILNTFIFEATSKVRRVISGDRWQMLVAFARTLGRGVSVVETAPGPSIEVVAS